MARASVVNAGRNTDRSDWRLVLKEGRGACSTKHALLAELARENGRHVALMLGIYEMCEDNTPGIGAVLERHGLPCIPDAHCYLAHEGTRVDLTREVEGAEYIEHFLHEEEIYPRQIGEYKVRAHRGFVRRWAMERGWDPERVWRVRERCIAALERRPRIEQRVKEAGKTNLTMTSLSHGRSQGGGDCS